MIHSLCQFRLGLSFVLTSEMPQNRKQTKNDGVIRPKTKKTNEDADSVVLVKRNGGREGSKEER